MDGSLRIWALTSPDRLGKKVRKLLVSPSTELYLSAISIWEAHHLHKRGKLRTKLSFTEWLDLALDRTPVREVPFQFAVAREASLLRLPPGDPGDLFLAATASVFGLTLLTSDDQLLACDCIHTHPNE